MSRSPRSWFTATPHPWLIPGLTLLLLVVLSVPYLLKVLHVREGQSIETRSAILRWRPQLLEMEAGQDISGRHNYPNPPIMGLVLLPVAQLPPLASALAWYYVKAILAAVTLFWIFRWLAGPDQAFPAWAQILIVLLSLRPILGDLQHGNVNLFIFFLVAGALTLYRLRLDGLSGLVLGLAIACKVTPALFLPYLVWKRSWRALAGTAAGLALFLWPGYLPSQIMGAEPYQKQLVSWYNLMVHPFVVEGKVTSEHENQSLPGVVHRLFTHSPSFSTFDKDQQYCPLRYDNVLSLQPEAARWLVKGCLGLFALLVVWSCRTPLRPRQGWRLPAEFSLILLGMLLFSERTWKHHGVTLALPFAVLTYVLAVERCGVWLKTYLAGTLALTAALMASTSTEMLPDGLAKMAQVYGAYVLAYFLLAGALAVLLRRPPLLAAAQEKCAENGRHGAGMAA
jgi:hypothetical protein